MERAIMTSEAFLRRPSDEATEDDLPVAADLMDTLAAHGLVRRHGREHDRRRQADHRVP